MSKARIWLLAALAVLSVNGNNKPRTFENTNIQRTVELGGSLTHVTTTFAVRALGSSGPSKYTFALSEKERSRNSLFEVRVKGNSLVLPVEKSGFDDKSNAYLYSVDLPLQENANATLVLNTVVSHASIPLPASVGQAEAQTLLFDIDAYVLSPYPTVLQRTKIRCPSSKVVSFSSIDELSKYADKSDTDAIGSRAGTIVTYGPFHKVPITASKDFQKKEQKSVSVHYEYDTAIVTVVELQRFAEISHWGANINIQDSVHLRNDGPVLKGHFSRLAHQHARFYKTDSPQALSALVLQLPGGIHTPYYYDSIGNVTTSRFRPAPILPAGSKRVQPTSYLEIKPRYPLLGGWNYTYTLGWDAPLANSAKYDKESGKYVVGIPFMTPIGTAAVDNATVTIILPEGALDITVVPPFDVESITRYTHIAYLDTIGRPAFVLKSSQLTDQHTGIIYVSYSVPLRAHLAKPVAVTTAVFGFFVLAIFSRRIDFRITSPSVKHT